MLLHVFILSLQSKNSAECQNVFANSNSNNNPSGSGSTWPFQYNSGSSDSPTGFGGSSSNSNPWPFSYNSQPSSTTGTSSVTYSSAVQMLTTNSWGGFSGKHNNLLSPMLRTDGTHKNIKWL